MKKLILLGGAALMLAGVALAANIDKNLNLQVQNRLWVGATQFVTSDNDITRSLGGIVDYDFPAIAPGYTILSPDFIIDGGRLGDPCSIGVLQSVADGGWDPQVRIACLVSSDNRVMILASSAGGDGGSPNPRDAGYMIRVISSQ